MKTKLLALLWSLLAAVEALAPATTSQRAIRISPLFATSTAKSTTASDGNGDAQVSAKEQRVAELKKQVKKEGGRFAFYTKYGALNPYAIYVALVSIFLGIPWFLAQCCLQLFYTVTRNKIDKQRRISILCSHIWGTTLMTLTRNWPKLEGREKLQEFYKQGRAAMFVANHNSWMDIPYLGGTIGWRNYKIIAKKELSKVPALGRAILVGGHVMVDRTDRKSQLQTLKSGMQYLKDRVILCTFPEGTRSKSGRLQEFKNGAFKMAFKTGSPVIPLSIVGAGKMQPTHWMFPIGPASKYGVKVVVHDPVESEGRTEEELAEAVRAAMITGLPEDQRPLIN